MASLDRFFGLSSNLFKPVVEFLKNNLTEKQKDLLRSAINLRVFSPKLSKNLVLILGCQRSGTTLTLLMLQAHPQIKGRDEIEFSSPFPFPSSWALSYYQLQKKLVCFKLPEQIFNVEYIAQHFPQAKILWIVRNPYSVISSMTLLQNNKGNWIERCALLELEYLMPFFPELKQIDLNSLDNISLAAMVWKYKNQALNIYQEKGLNVFPFRYEDLVSNPQLVMSDILKFLDLKWSDRVLEHHKFHQPEKTYPGNTKGDLALDNSRAVSTSAFNSSEKELITSIAGSLIAKYRYE